MKKLTALLCALVLLMSAASAALSEAPGGVPVQIYDEEAGAYGPETLAAGVRVTLDGAELELDVPAFIRTVDGYDTRTMVPVRAIAEGLGAQVEWLEGRQVLITRADDQILLTLGSSTALVNGEEVELPGGVPATMVASDRGTRTMVPLRFVSEQLHAQVGWEGATMTASIVTVAQPLAGYSVTLDAGHGGIYSGAYYERIMEKELTLDITLRVARLLEERGCRVVLTRWGDQTVDLYDRCDIANAAHTDIFVSIHANASVTSSTFQGTYTYSYPGSVKGAQLAQALQDATVAAAGSIDRGILTANFVVLRETWMPAALVETGFMTCHEELMRLGDPDYRGKLAQGIAQGVEDYFMTYGT